LTARLHPLAEARVSRYGEPPTAPDIDSTVAGAPRERPDWWPDPADLDRAARELEAESDR